MNTKRCERKWSWPNWWYYPHIYLRVLRKNRKTSIALTIAGLYTEIPICDLKNMKKCYLFNKDISYLHF